MRHLKLTHDEIELIQNALMYLSQRKLDIISANHNILTKDEKSLMQNESDKYSDLLLEITDGLKDV